MKQPRVAIVCDWLTNMGGAEEVVLAFAYVYLTMASWLAEQYGCRTSKWFYVDFVLGEKSVQPWRKAELTTVISQNWRVHESSL